MNPSLLSKLLELSTEAGEIIMKFHKHSSDYSTKDDTTPLTAADKASHEFLVNALEKLTPNIPILSEESSHIPFTVRQSWNEYWLIDPLDGTRDFIDGSPDFCISIAFIKQNYPTFGLIYSPFNKVHYYRLAHESSIKIVNREVSKIVTTKPKRWKKIVIGRYSTNNKKLKNTSNLKQILKPLNSEVHLNFVSLQKESIIIILNLGDALNGIQQLVYLYLKAQVEKLSILTIKH